MRSNYNKHVLINMRMPVQKNIAATNKAPKNIYKSFRASRVGC
jgi:hypothetical protein